MSWPHILSFSRVVAAPLVAALVLSSPGDAYLLSAVIFALASLTDLVDGKLARHVQRVSPLGIFLDTTADKILVSVVLVAMAIAGLTWAWIVLIIIAREFFITGLRSFAASRQHIISAHIWGKGKAALTMIAIFLVLLAADGKAHGILSRLGSHSLWKDLFTIAGWVLGAAAILTVASGIRYIVDAWPLFRPVSVLPERGEDERPRIAAGDR
jgi:CDP-diacylglycerol---glycerol-3-phosphate 3-phosphatidyltransferase